MSEEKLGTPRFSKAIIIIIVVIIIIITKVYV